MARDASLPELLALEALTRQFESIKRGFLGDDRQRAHPQPLVTLPGPAGEISLDDWDSLLSAVKARLRLTVGDSLTQQFNGAAAPVQASVLECVDALDQLHVTLAHALGRRALDEWADDGLAQGATDRLGAARQGPGEFPAGDEP